jgi:hypothetical protein
VSETKLPNAKVIIAIAREAVAAKSKAADILAPMKDRHRAFYENNEYSPKAMALLSTMLKEFGKNEIRAQDISAHCRYALDVFDNETREKGHAGNLVDMAKGATAEQAVAGLKADADEPKDAALAPADALKKLRAARDKNPPPSPSEVEDQQSARAAKRNNVPAADADEDISAEPKKRGRPPKLSVVQDYVPAAPPAPVSILDDDEEAEWEGSAPFAPFSDSAA